MEALRIELELEKQKFNTLGPASTSRTHSLGRHANSDNRDSGLADMDSHIVLPPTNNQPNSGRKLSGTNHQLSSSASEMISLSEASGAAVAAAPKEKKRKSARKADEPDSVELAGGAEVRRASVTSLDSGMSSTASTTSRESSPLTSAQVTLHKGTGGSLDRRELKLSQTLNASESNSEAMSNSAGGSRNSPFSFSGLFGAGRNRRSAANTSASSMTNSSGANTPVATVELQLPITGTTEV